jgi:hypothetical protein
VREVSDFSSELWDDLFVGCTLYGDCDNDNDKMISTRSSSSFLFVEVDSLPIAKSSIQLFPNIV